MDFVTLTQPTQLTRPKEELRGLLIDVSSLVEYQESLNEQGNFRYQKQTLLL